MQSQKFTFGKFRINDVSATDDNIELRRKVPVENFGQRATYVNEKTLSYRYMVSLDIHTLAGYLPPPPYFLLRGAGDNMYRHLAFVSPASVSEGWCRAGTPLMLM